MSNPTNFVDDTILGRLRDIYDAVVGLLTGIVLATGSAIIGRVGHDMTGIGHGVKTVTTAGTDVALVSSSTPAKLVIVQAQTDNTNAVAVGGSGVDATVATGTGVILYPFDPPLVLEVDNVADVFVDSLVNGEGVRFIYLT